MKKLSTLFLVTVFTVLTIVAYSQTTSEKTNADDKQARAVLASYYLEIPVNFESAKAEAYLNLLLNAYRNNVAYPGISLNNISSGDRSKIEKLQMELEALRNNPPSWDLLLAKEEAKLASQYSAPTAPVFATNPNRTTMSKNKVRIVGTTNGKAVEQSTQNNVENPNKD